MGNLSSNRVYDWQPEDYQVSAVMQEYFANFVKTGNPNGIGLPDWPESVKGTPAMVMHIDVNTRAEADQWQERYKWLDEQFNPGK
jgi:para-nitrobenzyl esterase